MAAWAWPVEGWELLDTDDELSDDAELNIAAGNAAADAAAAVGVDDPQDAAANVDRSILLSQLFGDA